MRVFAVLAAILLVGAFTLATVLPPDLPLAAALAMLDGHAPTQVQTFVNSHLPDWVWPVLMSPVLARPAWLLPAALGLVAAGAAATSASWAGPSRSRRRS